MMTLSRSERTTRKLLVFAATTSIVGIAFSASKGEEAGSLLSVGGVLLFIYALHRFGRTGPDRPT